MATAAKARSCKPAKRAPAKEEKKDLSTSYNSFKEFEGQQYTGMKVGRSHKWFYDKGEWKEKKSLLTNGRLIMLLPSEERGKRPRAVVCQ